MRDLRADELSHIYGGTGDRNHHHKDKHSNQHKASRTDKHKDSNRHADKSDKGKRRV